jgi:hypothetical protein
MNRLILIIATVAVLFFPLTVPAAPSVSQSSENTGCSCASHDSTQCGGTDGGCCSLNPLPDDSTGVDPAVPQNELLSPAERKIDQSKLESLHHVNLEPYTLFLRSSPANKRFLC